MEQREIKREIGKALELLLLEKAFCHYMDTVQVTILLFTCIEGRENKRFQTTWSSFVFGI